MIFNIGGYDSNINPRYLFSSGNTHSDITGGWRLTGDNIDEWVVSDATTITKSTGYSGGGEGNWTYVNCTTGSMVDLTDYKTLSVTFNSLDDSIAIFIINSSGTIVQESRFEYITSGTKSADISSLSGSYKIRLHWYGTEHGGEVNTSATITEIKMTK